MHYMLMKIELKRGEIPIPFSFPFGIVWMCCENSNNNNVSTFPIWISICYWISVYTFGRQQYTYTSLCCYWGWWCFSSDFIRSFDCYFSFTYFVFFFFFLSLLRSHDVLAVFDCVAWVVYLYVFCFVTTNCPRYTF